MNIISKILSKFFNNKKTFMEQEIYKQPDIIFQIIRKYVNKDYTININVPSGINKVALIASGSSYHNAAIASNFIRENIHIDAQSYYASEMALLNDVTVDSQTLYIFISQSGETSDTNKALNLINTKTKNTMAITNTKNSTLYNNAEYKVLTYAGHEKAIASTKAMCAQMYCLFLICVKIMQNMNIPYISVIDEMLNVPEYINNAFSKSDKIKEYSEKLSHYENASILASGMFYPLAKEGALKIKETSYINTTAYPTGEFLHGHIAILNKKCALISVVNNKNISFVVDVLTKIHANYKTESLIITALPVDNLNSENIISFSTQSDIDFLFSSLVVFQLLAFYTAQHLNRNIDKPIGLSKIVK